MFYIYNLSVKSVGVINYWDTVDRGLNTSAASY